MRRCGRSKRFSVVVNDRQDRKRHLDSFPSDMKGALGFIGVLLSFLTDATYQELIQPHPCGDNDPFCPTYCYWCHIHFGETSMECLQTMLVDECIRQFEMSMLSRNSSDWCLWSKVSGVYSNLSHCTEKFSDCLMIPWPNPLVEQTFVGIHSQYFADCPTEELIDPPPGIIFALVITPICLIPIMVSLVVLKTKNGDGSS